MASALSSGTRKYLHLRGTDPNLDASQERQGYASKVLEDILVTVPDDEHYDIDGTYIIKRVLLLLSIKP